MYLIFFHRLKRLPRSQLGFQELFMREKVLLYRGGLLCFGSYFITGRKNVSSLFRGLISRQSKIDC